MLRLSEVDRHRALGLLQAGIPVSEVSLRVNVNRTTIFRVRQRLHETDTEHAVWNRIECRSVVFSDESRFCIDHADGCVLVWRKSGEDTEQIALGNTTCGVGIFDDVLLYWEPKGSTHFISRSLL
ncbi:hypothetical protein ElyMa_006610000 [Elysia marginata]|uniref:Transposase IS30-like HTH domain-containing protein n=1 Tax=Elysia marginata TaxID=1093978 RepID=A0AAV4IIM5_9GAST|nr:hypothetical protein ElyMa_006610000 [Elysia marginata]